MATKTGVRYINDFPGLPADAPPGHPHIVDLRDFHRKWKRLSVVDVTVTILYNYKIDALKAFLDLNRREYMFWHRDDKGENRDFFVRRTGKTLIMGLHYKWKTGEFDDVCECQIAGNQMGLQYEWEPGEFFDVCECRLSESGDWEPVSWTSTYRGHVVEPKEIQEGILLIIGPVCDNMREYWKQPRDGTIISTHGMRKDEEGLFKLVRGLEKRELFEPCVLP